ncbi:MAG: metallophosphoesterase [Hyphomicrobiales bacterium]|nr:metallophosphoesterase [Hyphomicrobiales bacterium]
MTTCYESIRRHGRRLAAVTLWMSVSAPLLAQEPAAARVLALSDLHLDPFASPAVARKLVTAPLTQWPVLLDQPGPDRFGKYGWDSTWPLLRSALDQARAVVPDPAFIILTGDLIAHRFKQRFEETIGRPDEKDYRRFVAKTATFVGEEIIKRFPGKRVFLALGNEDSECGDYKLTPQGHFLHETLPLARQLTGANDPTFDRDWVTGRGYDLPSPDIPKLRLIYVNSVYLSAEYRDACNSGAANAGDETMAWLAARLAAAERAGDKAWLLFHIPPGADAYATLRHGACPTGLTRMWAPGHTQALVQLVERHARTIVAAFAGHTHMDEFRLIGRNGRTDGFVVHTPGISPIFGQNPGFHVYTYGRDAQLVDRDTWGVDDLSVADVAGGPAWRRTYRFSELWQVSTIDTPSLTTIDRWIANDPQARGHWFSTYPVGRIATWRVPDASQLPLTTFSAYHCAIGRIVADEYRNCLCGSTPVQSPNNGTR